MIPEREQLHLRRLDVLRRPRLRLLRALRRGLLGRRRLPLVPRGLGLNRLDTCARDLLNRGGTQSERPLYVI